MPEAANPSIDHVNLQQSVWVVQVSVCVGVVCRFATTCGCTIRCVRVCECACCVIFEWSISGPVVGELANVLCVYFESTTPPATPPSEFSGVGGCWLT